MAIYKLDVEKKYGQYHLRLYPQGARPTEFGAKTSEMRGLIAHLDSAIGDLDLKVGGDSVIFRQIEYNNTTSLRETVRFSKY